MPGKTAYCTSSFFFIYNFIFYRSSQKMLQKAPLSLILLIIGTCKYFYLIFQIVYLWSSVTFFLLIVWKKFLLQFNFEVPLVSRQLRQLKEERSIHNSLRQSSWTRHCFLTRSLFVFQAFVIPKQPWVEKHAPFLPQVAVLEPAHSAPLRKMASVLLTSSR